MTAPHNSENSSGLPPLSGVSEEINSRFANYEILREIGRGGMGVVYSARDVKLDRFVAIKTLPQELLQDHQYVTRLRIEAKALAALNHPRISTIYSLNDEGPAPFLVLEFVEGGTLAERIEKRKLELRDAISLCAQIAEAVLAAHEHGIVHRDLKPANVKITPAGSVKILDFGLAKQLDLSPKELKRQERTRTEVTRPGVVLGTPRYMSPEQSRGLEVDERTDVWAFGCVLYECLTGNPAFDGSSFSEVAQRIQEQEPNWAALPTDTPSRVETILRHCLEKRVHDRKRSLREVDIELTKALVAPDHYSRRRHNLGEPVTSFVGRHRELDEITDLLSSARLITLTGAAGCGKSRIAEQIARNVLARYPNGVWLVELASLTQRTLIPKSIAAVFGLKEDTERSILECLIDFLTDKQLLILLDNCEHLLVDCARVAADLLAACPNLTIVATSREGLGIPGETTYPVAPFSCPSADELIDPEESSKFDAVALFLDRARAVLPRFSLPQEHLEFLAQICERLDGIPLALELAAARVRVLTLPQIAHRLDDAFRLLTGGNRTALPRQQTLEAGIRWSFDLLDEKEQILFRRLSAFSAGWQLDAAEQVCSGGLVQEFDVLDLLTHLVEKSLVAVDESGLECRYRLLGIVRHFAVQRLVEANEESDVRERHLQFFTKLSKNAHHHLDGPDQGDWLCILERDHGNLRTAIEYGMSRDKLSTASLELAVLLRSFWVVAGHLEEGKKWLTQTLGKVGKEEGSSPVAEALYGLGQLTLHSGDFANARNLFQESVDHAKLQDEKKILAVALNQLGFIAQARREYEKAESILQESLAIAREVGDQTAVAAALHHLGLVAEYTGDREKARSLCEESLRRYRDLDELRGVAAALNSLGNLSFAAADLHDARRLLEEGLVIQRKLGHRHGIARSLASLASLFFAQQRCSDARSYWEESLKIDRQLGARRFVASTLIRLSQLAVLAGDYQAAHEHCTESLAISREQGRREAAAVSLDHLGIIAQRTGDFESARSWFEESLSLREGTQNESALAQSLRRIASFSIARGRNRQAALLFGAANTLTEASEAFTIAGFPGFDGDLERLQTEPAEEENSAAMLEGSKLPLKDMVKLARDELALADPAGNSGAPGAPPSPAKATGAGPEDVD